MELDTWSPDWGLPSVDPECIKILAFAKFSGAPIAQKSTNNPFWTPKGDLPVLRHDGLVLTDFNSTARHLRDCNYSADYNLSSKQLAEASAFIQLMDEKLSPALKFLMWMDAKNHLEVTRPWFGAHLPFPLGLYYPNKFEGEAVSLLESLYPQCSEVGGEGVVETAVYRAAEECLTILSQRLGESQYMFGKSPSSLDAVMYGLLGPLLKAPLPSNTLQNYLKNCDNLVRFVVRVSQNYFPRVVKAWEESKESKARPPPKSEGEQGKTGGEQGEEWPNKRRNQILAGCLASGAMLGYAYRSGLAEEFSNIHIRIGEEEEYEEEE